MEMAPRETIFVGKGKIRISGKECIYGKIEDLY